MKLGEKILNGDEWVLKKFLFYSHSDVMIKVVNFVYGWHEWRSAAVGTLSCRLNYCYDFCNIKCGHFLLLDSWWENL
jgi:hypothetical protein